MAAWEEFAAIYGPVFSTSPGAVVINQQTLKTWFKRYSWRWPTRFPNGCNGMTEAASVLGSCDLHRRIARQGLCWISRIGLFAAHSGWHGRTRRGYHLARSDPHHRLLWRRRSNHRSRDPKHRSCVTASWTDSLHGLAFVAGSCSSAERRLTNGKFRVDRQPNPLAPMT
jgi:hypothetical protein